MKSQSSGEQKKEFTPPFDQELALVIYVVIFLDLLGFGMLIPDIQLRAEHLGAPGWLIGLILASTFIAQVPFSPLWGRASDKLGRKPVLLLCTAFSASGMFIYGLAGSIPMLIFSRILSGVGGANVAIAQALLADSSDKDGRIVAMGRLSASVSLGLIGGPILGGVVAAEMGSRMVGLLAGTSSALGGLFILLLIQSRARPAESSQTRGPSLRLELFREAPRVRGLALIAAVSWFSLATVEGTFGRLIEHTLGFGQTQFGVVFGYESMLSFVVQAWLLAWVSRRLPETRLLRIGYVLQGIGLALTPFTYMFPIHWAWMAALLGCSTFYALGAALSNPTLNSLCSKLTPDRLQGELFGVLQGTRSIGFIVGPILGGALFDRWFAAPYLLAGATCAVAAGLLGTKVVPSDLDAARSG